MKKVICAAAMAASIMSGSFSAGSITQAQERSENEERNTPRSSAAIRGKSGDDQDAVAPAGLSLGSIEGIQEALSQTLRIEVVDLQFSSGYSEIDESVTLIVDDSEEIEEAVEAAVKSLNGKGQPHALLRESHHITFVLPNDERLVTYVQGVIFDVGPMPARIPNEKLRSIAKSWKKAATKKGRQARGYIANHQELIEMPESAIALALFGDDLSSSDLELLPRFTKVKRISLIGFSEIEALEYLSPLTSLGHVSLCGYKNKELAQDGLKHLANLPGLTSIDLSHSVATSPSTFEVVSTMSKLTTLKVSECRNFTDQDVDELSKSESLTEIDASACLQLTEASCGSLAKIDTLTKLNLNGTGLGDKGFRQLMSLGLSSLLFATHRHVSSEALQHLGKASILKELELNIGNKLDDGDSQLEAISNVESLIGLNLHFAAKYIPDSGVEALTKLKHLRSLNLSGSNINDEHLEVISTMENLEELDLSNCDNITGKGAQVLWKLQNLKALNLLYCDKFYHGSVRLLQQRLKECDVSDPDHFPRKRQQSSARSR